ncbi:MAG: hypothetical protein HY053_06760, partial [Proteobacteria bacterium]|nr:hypothetical protein [Pseudomonadota bacterium]
MSWSRTLLNFFADAFRPPFRTTPWIVLLYAVLSVVYNHDSHFNRWTLPDTDDYMRLVQMLNWVGGQSWFDLHLPRLYPQHLITMHWGRLPDIPLAGFFFVLRMLAIFFRWQAEAQSLAMLTAFLWPPVLLGLLLFLMREIARPLMGKARAPLICFFVPLCTQLIFQFMPMRVDHHAYILL